MRTAFYLIFLGSVCYLTKEHSCLKRIDLPMRINLKSKAWKNPFTTVPSTNLKSKHSYYYERKSSEFQYPPIRPTTRKFDKSSKLQYPPIRSTTRKFDLSSKFQYPPIRSTTRKFDIRRYFPVNADGILNDPNPRALEYDDESNVNLKTKISTLVEQTLHDTERKVKSIQTIKEQNRETAPYKAGFILSMIKKSRDVLNELFNVAVKHKDEWRALEQMKIFEMIMHTNVDTTNLVRQLVEIHIQHLNSTNPDNSEQGKSRVVLLR